MRPELLDFGRNIATLNLSETEIAVALLWFLDHFGSEEASASELALLTRRLALRGYINVSRLAQKLSAHSSVVRGSKRGFFEFDLVHMSRLLTSMVRS